MVSFLIAFGFTCLQDSGIASRSVVATLCGIILILTFWSIWTSWRNQEPSDADQPKRTILTFEEERAKRKEKGFNFKFKKDDLDDTKSQPTKRVLRSLKKAFKAPVKKLSRDKSKKAAEEPIDENYDMEMSSSLKSKLSNI